MQFKKSLIPNYLTILRILLVPIIITLSYCGNLGAVMYTASLKSSESTISFHYTWFFAGILFIVASFTDFLDGYLSRKYNWVSDFGKLWDPLADKILVNSILIVFAGANPMHQQFVFFIIPILMIIRDTIVDGYRMYASSKGIVVAANWWGKWKTTVQILAIVLIYFFFAWGYPANTDSTFTKCMWWLVQNLFMWIALFLSLVSGGIYIYRITKSLRTNSIK